jgi:outer membrane protein OmpA-like peptidoglycan-associated protein
MRLRFAALLTLSLGASPVLADLGFPDSVKLPPQIVLVPEQALVKETLGEATIAIDASGSKTETKRGAHYQRWFAYKPAAGEPAPGYYNGTEARIHKALLSTLGPAGWQLVFSSEGKDHFTMKRGEAWLAVKMDAPQAQVNLELVEAAGAKTAFALKVPAEKPESFGDKDDIPWLAPYPGSTRKDGGRSNDPLDVAPPGKGDGEPRLVGSGTAYRSYAGPSTLSLLQFQTDYRAALTAAGWTVLYPAAGVTNEGMIIAHYAKGARDLWARLTYEYGANLAVAVADVGTDDWAAKLAKDCRLPLYGVFFDFNKSSIKPESDSVLQKAAKALGAKPAFSVEVQGHTDNVGGDAYNLELSNARAGAVRAWLASHGVDGAKLTAKGYGKTQPVADNGTDAGRAKNRRVELRRADCTPR